MQLSSIFAELGFRNREQAVYMALLELGIAPSSVIARKSGLKRTTVNGILDTLCSRGLCERFLKQKIRHYSPLPPPALIEKYEKITQNLHGMLPQMMALYNTQQHKPAVRYFEGKEGVTSLFLEVLEAKESEVLNYFEPGKTIPYFGKEWLEENHISVRLKRNLKLRSIISQNSEWFDHYKKVSKDELRELRMLKNADLHFQNETHIYDNKMNIFSFAENFALQIESDIVVQSQKILFELAWESRLVEA